MNFTEFTLDVQEESATGCESQSAARARKLDLSDILAPDWKPSNVVAFPTAPAPRPSALDHNITVSYSNRYPDPNLPKKGDCPEYERYHVKIGGTTLRKFAVRLQAGEWRKAPKEYTRMVKLGRMTGAEWDSCECWTGVMGDYDAGVMPKEEAAELARKAGIGCMFYDSPSHGIDGKHKWRVTAVTSATMKTPDEMYDQLDRLNGALGGILGVESWDRGRRYHFGKKSGTLGVITVDGDFIDKVSGIVPVRHLSANTAAKREYVPVEGFEEATPEQCEWAEDELRKWADRLTEGEQGDRHQVLIKAGRWSGGAVARGFLDQEQVEAALLPSAIANGMGERRFRIEFPSSFEYGLRRPITDFLDENLADDFDDLADTAADSFGPGHPDYLLDDDAPPPKRARPQKRTLEPANPMPSARAMVKDCHTTDGLRTMHRYRGTFWKWDGACYREADPEGVGAHVWTYLERSLKEATNRKGETFIADFAPTKTSVGNVLDALEAVCNVDASTETPTWLKVDGAAPANELVAVANGLLHLPSGGLLRPSPSFFNMAASGVAFDIEAPEPTEWLRFLGQLWPEDQESIDTLQDIFGYLLSPDASQHKIPFIVGPPRSGKGTIGRILTAMIGQNNTVAPTLASLPTQFGLAPLIGKSVAIVGDARLSPKVDQSAIAERLLSISGEDSITIDRKFRSSWTGRLPVRFLILSNDLPALFDASGALASRFLLLQIKVSFLGREDRALEGRLLRELPGILNWARAGYLRLNARGYFVPPSSANAAVKEMEALGSPVRAFVEDRCIIGAGRRVLVDSAYVAWRIWCAENGRREPGTKQSFSRQFHAAFPRIETKEYREGGKRPNYFEGIALRSDDECDDRFDDLL